MATAGSIHIIAAWCCVDLSINDFYTLSPCCRSSNQLTLLPINVHVASAPEFFWDMCHDNIKRTEIKSMEKGFI